MLSKWTRYDVTILCCPFWGVCLFAYLRSGAAAFVLRFCMTNRFVKYAGQPSSLVVGDPVHPECLAVTDSLSILSCPRDTTFAEALACRWGVG